MDDGEITKEFPIVTNENLGRMDRELMLLKRQSKDSGRVIGMDVVKTNMEKIGGMVELVSCGGPGTAIRIKIPDLAVRSGPR